MELRRHADARPALFRLQEDRYGNSPAGQHRCGQYRAAAHHRELFADGARTQIQRRLPVHPGSDGLRLGVAGFPSRRGERVDRPARRSRPLQIRQSVGLRARPEVRVAEAHADSERGCLPDRLERPAGLCQREQRCLRFHHQRRQRQGARRRAREHDAADRSAHPEPLGLVHQGGVSS